MPFAKYAATKAWGCSLGIYALGRALEATELASRGFYKIIFFEAKKTPKPTKMFCKSKNRLIIWGLSLFFITTLFSCSKTAPTPAPVASFNWAATSTTAPATVNFTNTSTNGKSYLWDFGDGGTSTNFSPTYTFTKGGSFTVKLTVTGDGGTASTSQTINITTPTSLQITIKDDLGNPVVGASVKLYSSITDWTNETNQVLTTQTSNANGVVVFSPLSAIKYFWKITKDCQNNLMGGNTTTTALTANNLNTINAVLAKTGTLTFKNNSTNPYDVFVNGVLTVANMAGGTTQSFIAPIGSYSIRVLQKSGYLISPTDKTYTGSLSCGGSLLTSFP